MDYNVKNYTEQGGEITHFGGKVIFEPGCVVEGMVIPIASKTSPGAVQVGEGLSITTQGVLSAEGFTPAANQPASTTTDIVQLVADFNSLLSKLKAAGIMVADGV